MEMAQPRVNIINDVFKALSDPNSLCMFKDIADDHKPQRKSLSTKQFYSTLSKLKRTNLIVKRKSNYELTALGKVVKHAIEQVEIAVSLSSELKAWDAIASQEDIQEKQTILQSLVKDERIRHILLEKEEQK
jgi:DNA-binding PadR family transcriptional regulator